jgi:hypothetical protein
MSRASIAKIAAFATLATILAMMAFVSIPAAHATLYKKVLVIKILNNFANIHHFKIKVWNINNGNLVYVKNVYIASGNNIALNAPITISGNSVNVCVQAGNIVAGAFQAVVQKCKQVTYSDTYIKGVSFSFG